MEIDEKVIDVLIVDREQLSVKLQQLHERNSQTDQETLDHVLSLNQTLHQKLIQLHSSLNTSSSRFNFSLSQQMDAFADVLTTLSHNMHQQQERQNDRVDGLTSDLQDQVRVLTILLTLICIILLSIPVLLWIRMRWRRAPGEDEVRLSEINDNY